MLDMGSQSAEAAAIHGLRIGFCGRGAFENKRERPASSGQKQRDHFRMDHVTVPRRPAIDDASESRGPLAQEDQFRLLVEAVEDYAIISLSVSGRVTGWNEGARRLKATRPPKS